MIGFGTTSKFIGNEASNSSIRNSFAAKGFFSHACGRPYLVGDPRDQFLW